MSLQYLLSLGNDLDIHCRSAKITTLTMPSLVKGDILAVNASGNLVRVAVGTNGQVLTADSTQASGVKWATP